MRWSLGGSYCCATRSLGNELVRWVIPTPAEHLVFCGIVYTNSGFIEPRIFMSSNVLMLDVGLDLNVIGGKCSIKD